MIKIVALFVAVFQLIGAIGLLGICLDLKADFDEYHEKIRDDPDPKHLNNYMDKLADDIVNITIDEIEGTTQGIILDELE